MSISDGHLHIPPPDHVNARALEASARHEHRMHSNQRGDRSHSGDRLWRALTWSIRLVFRAITWPIRRALRA